MGNGGETEMPVSQFVSLKTSSQVNSFFSVIFRTLILWIFQPLGQVIKIPVKFQSVSSIGRGLMVPRNHQ